MVGPRGVTGILDDLRVQKESITDRLGQSDVGYPKNFLERISFKVILLILLSINR